MAHNREEAQVSAGWFWQSLVENNRNPRTMPKDELGELIDQTRRSGNWEDADLLSMIYDKRFPDLAAQKSEIESDLEAIHERVEALCRAAVKEICDAEGWSFESHQCTHFYTSAVRGDHDYCRRGEFFKEQEMPADFRDLFVWADGLRAFPDMIYKGGRWVA